MQFLVEAVTLSVICGLLGLDLALIATVILAQVMHVPLVFDPLTNLMALRISATIYVIFGDVPARRAARLDPIDALRHEWPVARDGQSPLPVSGPEARHSMARRRMLLA